MPERELADAAIVTAVAVALREWESATGRRANFKPLRETVWFYWQSTRLPRPLIRSKYPTSIMWSESARVEWSEDPAAARLVIEHAEPMNLLLRRLVDDEALTPRRCLSLLRPALLTTVITAAEHRDISAAGLANSMPAGWVEGDDPLARYKAAGIDVDQFAPLQGGGQ